MSASLASIANLRGQPRSFWSARDLVDAEFPEPRWAVPGLVPEGLSLLVGPPKVGKSWLALGLALACASGGQALGSVEVPAGDVLYLALEDTPRRLQSRILRCLGPGASVPGRLDFATEIPPLADGGREVINDWLARSGDARLLVVDVLAKVRGNSDPRSSRYDQDYEVVSGLKSLADAHRVAVLVLHHTRKAAGEDFLDSVSGTNGLTGAADSTLIIRRSRTQADAVLQITGRDVEEAEHALAFDGQAGSWRLLNAPVQELSLGDTRRRILELLRNDGPHSPRQVADALSIDRENAKKTLYRMVESGQLDSADGIYSLPYIPLSPLSPQSPPGDSGDYGDSLYGDIA